MLETPIKRQRDNSRSAHFRGHDSRGPGFRGRHDFRGGFSLIEVMVVIVILGLLAGAVVMKVGGYMDTAEVNRAKSDIATIVDAIELYRMEHKRYPSNEEGLDNIQIENRTDPWGNRYEYNSPGSNDEPYEVVTYGADGRQGGEGTDADIYSWQVRDAGKDNR